MFSYIGVEVEVMKNQVNLRIAHMVLPKVGSFATGMKNLEKSGFVSFIRDGLD